MLRTDTFRALSSTKPSPRPSPPRVGAGTRSKRSDASSRTRSTRANAVEIQEKRFGYFPQRFKWRGNTHTVQAVERCWTRTFPSAKLCFRVRCQAGTFDLTQTVKTDIWSLSVVQLVN